MSGSKRGNERIGIMMPVMLHRSLAAATTESRATQWRPSFHHTSLYSKMCAWCNGRRGTEPQHRQRGDSSERGRRQRDKFTDCMVDCGKTSHRSVHSCRGNTNRTLVTALGLLWANYRNPLLWQYMKRETSFSCRQGRWWQWDSNQGAWQCSRLMTDSRTFITNMGEKIIASTQGCSVGSNGWKKFCFGIHSKGVYKVYLLCKEELPRHYIS